MFIGIILLIIGVAFFLKNAGVIDAVTWSIIWPLLVVFVGLFMVFRKKKFWD